ncbi:MAG TPA: hypothetical protein PKW35_12700 [Nannocystaceae bacterium]|nr:hypothetical protein [Nannocystaceae bacterium]
MDAINKMASDLADAKLVLKVVRLGTHVYDGVIPNPEITSACFPQDTLRDLRAVSAFNLFATFKSAIVVCSITRGGSDRGPSLSVNIQNQPSSEAEALGMRIVVAAHAAGLIGPSVSEDLRQSDGAALQALAQQVAAFRDLVNNQARANEAIRQELVREFDSRRKQVDDELTTRRAKLEAELEERRAALEKALREKKEEADAREAEKAAELVAKEQALDERAKSLDLQGEREQRRMLRRDIQDAAKRQFENPDLSADAKVNFARVATACRWIIGGSAIFLVLALFGPMVIQIATQVTPSADVLAVAWSLRALAGIALFSCAIYYVRWLAMWSRQVTTNELRSRQFALDIDRASWLVEMSLEYEKNGVMLRSSLVDSFSRGLFEAEHKPSREQPSNSLLHLIRNAESLKVGAAGAELSLTGRQVQRADAQAAKDHEA